MRDEWERDWWKLEKKRLDLCCEGKKNKIKRDRKSGIRGFKAKKNEKEMVLFAYKIEVEGRIVFV